MQTIYWTMEASATSFRGPFTFHLVYPNNFLQKKKRVYLTLAVNCRIQKLEGLRTFFLEFERRVNHSNCKYWISGRHFRACTTLQQALIAHRNSGMHSFRIHSLHSWNNTAPDMLMFSTNDSTGKCVQPTLNNVPETSGSCGLLLVRHRLQQFRSSFFSKAYSKTHQVLP